MRLTMDLDIVSCCAEPSVCLAPMEDVAAGNAVTEGDEPSAGGVASPAVALVKLVGDVALDDVDCPLEAGKLCEPDVALDAKGVKSGS